MMHGQKNIKLRSVSLIKTSQLMLYRKIIAVCSQIYTKHTIHCVGRTLNCEC